MEKTQSEVLTNRVREAVIASIIITGERARWAGVQSTQEEWGAAVVLGTLEAVGIILAEAFKNQQMDFVKILPRCDEILSRTVRHVWQTGHTPGCDCPDQQR